MQFHLLLRPQLEGAAEGEGIGQLQFVSVRVLESEGVLLDMWNALQFLPERHPDEIESVEWFTFAEGFRSDHPPHLIQFPTPSPGREDGRVRSAQEKWCQMDPTVPVQDTRTRAVLVMCVQVQGIVLCLIEIDRRPVNGKEERFSGLVFRLGSSDDLERLLPPIPSELPSVRGRMGNLDKHRPQGAERFEHYPSATDRVPCEGTVANAFGKMGLTLSDSG